MGVCVCVESAICCFIFLQWNLVAAFLAYVNGFDKSGTRIFTKRSEKYKEVKRKFNI